MSTKRSDLWKALGPGLLYAGAAVGVSHLVQSTRAGAQFGYALIYALVLANLVKYPFFLMGPQYTAATGESLLAGYKKLGNWAVWSFLVLTILTMFFVIAAIAVVTAGLAGHLLPWSFDPVVWSIGLTVFCALILLVGKYSLLDRMIKWVILILSVTTLVAFFSSFGWSAEKVGTPLSFSFKDQAHLLFLFAFIGWMPAPMDISIWHSVWAETRNKLTGHQASPRQARFDFNVGFIGTALLAICFLVLGARMFYGTGNELEVKSLAFAGQLIDMYTTLLGPVFFWVIALAAFTTMFSTTLTCLDAFPRVLSEASGLLTSRKEEGNKKTYPLFMLVLVAGTILFILFLLGNMGQMVDLATTLSFLTTPFLALLNFLAIRQAEKAGHLRMNPLLKGLSYVGFLVLIGMAIWYPFIRFGMAG
ncbi:divalent metal cation transporter [bacterium SCSIO 12741]|nr:divalent metal cation transporter [bacterium SCSIO 12741]